MSDNNTTRPYLLWRKNWKLCNKEIIALPKLTSLLLLIVISPIQPGCTNNPFGGETISTPQKQIRGQIELLGEVNLTPDNVYVWFEGFDLATQTDEFGRFQLSLPPPASQNASGGLNGLFKLYYYAANFKLDFTEVAVRNGELVLPKGEVDREGKLRQPKKLLQFLRVETSVTPAELSYSDFDSTTEVIQVEFTLQAFQDTVSIFFPTVVGTLRGPVIFNETKTGQFFVLESMIRVNEIRASQTMVRAVPRKRIVAIPLRRDLLPPGDYKIIPYLLAKHEAIPTGLIKSLGPDVMALGPNYLKLPMKRSGGNFGLR